MSARFALWALFGLANGVAVRPAQPRDSMYTFDFNEADYIMDDCSTVPAGTAVPNNSSFFLPMESRRQARSFPICLDDDTTTCTTAIPVVFDIERKSILLKFSALSGYTYREATVDVEPTGRADGTRVGKTLSLSSGECAADDSTASSVTCTLYYGDVVSADTTADADLLRAMCPFGESGGVRMQFQTSATLIDRAGTSHSAHNRQSCNDWPTCADLNPAEYFQLSYRCTLCPEAGVDDSPTGDDRLLDDNTTSTTSTTSDGTVTVTAGRTTVITRPRPTRTVTTTSSVELTSETTTTTTTTRTTTDTTTTTTTESTPLTAAW